MVQTGAKEYQTALRQFNFNDAGFDYLSKDFQNRQSFYLNLIIFADAED